MHDAAYIIQFTGRSLFLAVNIILLYIFLTPVRPRFLQAFAFISTWVVIFLIRKVLAPFNFDPLLDSYIMGSLYFIPCLILFKETLQAKFFIFYMIYSLTQLVYLIFIHIDRFFSPEIPETYVLAGMIIELAALPFINRYLKEPVRDILDIINQHNPVFTVYPVLSFLLFAAYGLQRVYTLSGFIILVLSTTLIFFSYYLIAITIIGTRLHQELEFMSMTDSLTGLHNRRYMEKKIRQMYDHCRKTGTEFALACADIDYFKNINDLYGHACGDIILKSLAEDIDRTIRENDSVARWGGEEFLILMPATSEVQAVEVAERVRRMIETGRYESDYISVPVTVTVGVTVIRPDDTPESLFKRTDMALYFGKRKSRNCVTSFTELDHIENRES
jgi:diguanylate cyclase (GGDEF)-like protein